MVPPTDPRSPLLSPSSPTPHYPAVPQLHPKYLFTEVPLPWKKVSVHLVASSWSHDSPSPDQAILKQWEREQGLVPEPPAYWPNSNIVLSPHVPLVTKEMLRPRVRGTLKHVSPPSPGVTTRDMACFTVRMQRLVKRYHDEQAANKAASERAAADEGSATTGNVRTGSSSSNASGSDKENAETEERRRSTLFPPSLSPSSSLPFYSTSLLLSSLQPSLPPPSTLSLSLPSTLSPSLPPSVSPSLLLHPPSPSLVMFYSPIQCGTRNGCY